MASDDVDLVDEAAAALGVDRVRSLQGGGQKLVEVVEKSGDTLVLKVIRVTTSTPATIQRAEREVELLEAIDNSHVVKVMSSLEQLGDPPHGAAWLEEYLDGQDLADELFIQRWSWADTRALGLDVSDGLGAGHVRRVVHRDLSARNVRHLADGTFKVMDFGFARHTLRSGLTVAGQPGTPGYLSPEHLQSYSGGPTASSDVFCLGLLMYAALTGRLPIEWRGDEVDYIQRLLAVQIEDIAISRPDLAPDQAAVIRRCLHPQSARRFLNGQALNSALRGVSA